MYRVRELQVSVPDRARAADVSSTSNSPSDRLPLPRRALVRRRTTDLRDASQ